MNKLSKLKEQYAKLGEEIEALEKEFEPGWYAYWDNNTSNVTGYYIDFIRTNECLNKKLSSWDNVVKIDKDAFDKLLNPKTIYDWSKIPKNYNWAVTNKDGSISVCNCTDKPIVDGDGWLLQGERKEWWNEIQQNVVINPVDDWTESCEHRPE
jgi:hypothetical protein